jgi:ABC-type histidine transport system ATPase subunit
MIVATREMGFAAQVADTGIFIDHGKIAGRGTPKHVFHDIAPPRLSPVPAGLLRPECVLDASRGV